MLIGLAARFVPILVSLAVVQAGIPADATPAKNTPAETRPNGPREPNALATDKLQRSLGEPQAGPGHVGQPEPQHGHTGEAASGRQTKPHDHGGHAGHRNGTTALGESSAGDPAKSSHSPGAAPGHEGSEGLSLVAAGDAESVQEGSACAASAPVRSFRVAAINVDMTLNRYLDHDPNGRMYVLEEELDKVRTEEERNRRGREEGTEPAVTAGLQGDAIQPLTLRVNQGECLRIRLRNALKDGEAASLHLHDSELSVAGGSPAIATNPRATVAPGKSVNLEWMVGPGEQEGTHYFHSHSELREQTSHGLFGAVIVEPSGSEHLDPFTGKPGTTGWAAMIRTPQGSDFREFVLYYHEIGHENYRFLNGRDESLPLVDPLTGAYRPGARAMNYRSEPFMNRLQLQQSLTGRFDESVAYSSYVFGDPATPVGRSYLGDPVKERVIHAGSEVAHVHHVHGGATRWPRQPKAEPSTFDSGVQKRPPLTPRVSERIDSQTISPSETYDVEHECGSGGCQGSAGDFLIHCHVAHHYFAGMWGLWRVYNTLQDPASARGLTDSMPPLAELPDRRGRMNPAVDSSDLIGKTVDFGGRKVKVDSGSLAKVVEAQLPPPGVAKGYDASVLDWTRQGDLYLGEPDSDQKWPGFASLFPGERLPFRFDPGTGKLAYPFLRPHLGKRPPFPPNHNPAPFLDPSVSGPGPPEPGANGPNSICPAGTKLKEFKIQAIPAPVQINAKANITDPDGELYVLKEQEDAVRADPAKRIPLAIRANAREDCVDVVLRSELFDSELNHGFSKVNLHIHFVQFDIQASDGVIAGYNYEQSVRPFEIEGEKIAGTSAPSARTVTVSDAARFQPGAVVGVGMDQDGTFEVRKIESIAGAAVTFDRPLEHPHAAGEYVSTEFVRLRWYPDVQFGTAYFHDHVNALASWKHGLFGALVAEPPGASYHDPHSGEALRSGPLADIHSDGPLSPDIKGSFREMVLFIQDDAPLTHIGRSTGGTFNLRAEPLARRKGRPPDLFNSRLHGDPETPVFESHAGDPLVFRTLVAGTNEVHSFHIDGHWFRIEPYSRTSPWVQTAHLGISERYDLMVPSAGGPLAKPGDYLYRSGRPLKVAEGNWGLLRVHDPKKDTGLRPLPGREAGAAPGKVCPAGAPQKGFQIEAIEANIPGLAREGRMFVMAAGTRTTAPNGSAGATGVDGDSADGGRDSAESTGKSDRDARGHQALVGETADSPEPLVLRANSGDCIHVAVANRTPGGLAFHADGLVYDPAQAASSVGRNSGKPLGPGRSGKYTFFAHPQIGETVAVIRDIGDPVDGPRRGLYGAIVIGPPGARYSDPLSDGEEQVTSGASVEVIPQKGASYRDFTVFMHDEDPSIGSHKMPYIQKPAGKSAISYGAQPGRPRGGKALFSVAAGSRAGLETGSRSGGRKNTPGSRHDEDRASSRPGRPPILEAVAGERVKIHVVAAHSEQAQPFFLEGHRWKSEPELKGSDEMSSITIGGLETITIEPMGGAGGLNGTPGDYLYGSHRAPYTEAGMWGILRIHSRDSTGRLTALPLNCEGPGPVPEGCAPKTSGFVVALVGFAILALAALAWRKKRLSTKPLPGD